MQKIILKIFLIIRNSAHMQKRIFSASIKTMKIKHLPSSPAKQFNLRISCISSTEPLESKISTAIKFSVSLPNNQPCGRNNGGATPYLIKRRLYKPQYSNCYLVILKKTVKVMVQREALHYFLQVKESTCDTDIRLALVLL